MTDVDLLRSGQRDANKKTAVLAPPKSETSFAPNATTCALKYWDKSVEIQFLRLLRENQLGILNNGNFSYNNHARGEGRDTFKGILASHTQRVRKGHVIRSGVAKTPPPKTKPHIDCRLFRTLKTNRSQARKGRKCIIHDGKAPICHPERSRTSDQASELKSQDVGRVKAKRDNRAGWRIWYTIFRAIAGVCNQTL